MSTATPSPAKPAVVRVFVDFWNFHLSVQRWRPRFRFDWTRFGPLLTKEVESLRAASGSSRGSVRFGGLHVFMSFNPASPRDDGLRELARDLRRIPRMHVVLKARRPKDPPPCPGCHEPVACCPRCGTGMQRTGEKGMDTAIVTDMVRLAWDKRWDVAVLLSADGDFVPAVEHLTEKGLQVLHAGVAERPSRLARTCSASLDLAGLLRTIERADSGARMVRSVGAHATAAARSLLADTKEEATKKSCPSGSQNQSHRGLPG